jgi:hypothetical protein
VRRFLVILLLAFTSLPLASPLLAMATSDDASLPACCRRNGEHHCTYPAEWLTGGVYVAAPPMHCPFSPGMIAPVRRDNASLHGVAVAFAGWSIESLEDAHAQHGVRDPAARTSRTRGPPALRA